MLADQTPGIAPVTAGLAPKTGRVRDIAQAFFTEFVGVVDLSSGNIGYGHLSRRRQIKALLSLKPERIFGKLWQLSGTGQRCFVDDVGDVDFLIPVLLRVGIQHKLRQGTMQSR